MGSIFKLTHYPNCQLLPNGCSWLYARMLHLPFCSQGDIRMRRFLFGVVLTMISLVVLSPLASAAPGAVRCGHLLDVRTGHLLQDQVIVFNAGGIITNVGPAASPLSAGGATTVDLPSATC